MKKIVFVLGLFAQVLSEEALFRFDYEFSSQANGWFKFHPIPAVWTEARRRCYAEGEFLEGLYHIWAPGQPDNSTTLDYGVDLGEYCGSITRDKVQLNDSYCESRLTFLCEKDPASLY